MKELLKVLFVSDNLHDVHVISDLILLCFDCETKIVNTRKEYLSIFNSFNPGLIISDTSLHGFDAMAALTLKSEMNPDIPFIFITGDPNEVESVECIKAGADDYIFKQNSTRICPAIKSAINEKEISKQKRKRELSERKYAEEMLKHSEEKFHKAFHNSPDAITITRLSDGLITEINDSLTKISGYSREDILGQTIDDLHLWVINDDLDQYISILKHSGKVKDFESLFRTESGEIRSFLISGELFDIKGEKYVISIIHDISEQKLAGKLLKESEEKYHSIYESSGIPILLITTDGKVLSANESACTLFNMTKEGIRNAGIEGLIKSNDQGLPDLLKVSSINGKAKGLLTFNKKGGEKFKAEVSSVIFSDKDGNHLTNLVIRDLTEQIKSEEALRKSEARFRSYFELSGAGIAITSPATGWMEVNDQLCFMFGYPRNEIFRTTWPELTHPDDLDADLENFTKVIAGKIDEYSIDKRFIRKDGDVIWTNLSVRCVRDQSGQVEYMVALLFDVTERKSVESELFKAKVKAEESDRLKTAFLHNISHEIRTPLNAILGFGALLSEPGLSQETQATYLDIIQEGSDQLLSVINTIIDISSIEAKILNSNITSFNLNSALKSLYQQFLPKAHENSNTLNLDLGMEDKDAEIQSDSTRLKQIISNLLTNALKFTNNGRVDFGYTTNGDMIEFYVSDSGIGIPSDQHQRIFESFYQVESTFNRKYGGTGLGLSISKAYIELLGGKIWVISEPGVGSTFRFITPANHPEPAVSGLTEKSGFIKSDPDITSSILIAEDDDINFSLLKNYISDRNIRIIRAKNGKEAVEICKSTIDLELVLMDIRMPVMDGYTATVLIRQIRPLLPVIAQTAFADEKEQALKSGCIDFIAKPFTREVFRNLLDKHLKKGK